MADQLYWKAATLWAARMADGETSRFSKLIDRDTVDQEKSRAATNCAGCEEMAKRPTKPWWQEDGTEICSACHQLYLYEFEYRCSACDDALCFNCVVESKSLTTVCPGCFDCGTTQYEVA